MWLTMWLRVALLKVHKNNNKVSIYDNCGMLLQFKLS